MKSLNMRNRILAFLALGAGTTLLLTGSAANAAAYKLADKAGASIAEFRDEIVNVKKEVDASMASLDKVVTQATVNPRKAYEEFKKSVPRVDSAAAKAKKQAEDMKAKGQDYFKQWEKELAGVNNPEVRKLAEERKTKLQATFAKIKETTEPARDLFNTFLADLKDLQVVLGQDLTIAGIDAAKDPIAKTKSEGAKVQQTLDKVIAELNTVVATITPAKAKK